MEPSGGIWERRSINYGPGLRCAASGLRPSQLNQQGLEIRLRRRFQNQRTAARRIDEGQAGAGEEQPPAGESLREHPVVAALAVGGIADDGVGDVLEVPADLVTAAGFRRS